MRAIYFEILLGYLFGFSGQTAPDFRKAVFPAGSET